MDSAKVSYTRSLIIISVFTALSMGAGLIKLGTPVGSVALDSSSGFFVAAYFSPLLGAIVGGLGHLASAATAGFPLSGLHVAIAFLQAVWSVVFGITIRHINRRWAIPIAGVIAVLLNGVVAPLLLMCLAPNKANLFKSLIVFLVVAAALNVVVASLAFWFISRSRSRGL